MTDMPNLTDPTEMTINSGFATEMTVMPILTDMLLKWLTPILIDMLLKWLVCQFWLISYWNDCYVNADWYVTEMTVYANSAWSYWNDCLCQCWQFLLKWLLCQFWLILLKWLLCQFWLLLRLLLLLLHCSSVSSSSFLSSSSSSSSSSSFCYTSGVV